MTRIPPMAGKKTVYISSRNLSAQRTRGSGCKRKSLCLGKAVLLSQGASSRAGRSQRALERVGFSTANSGRLCLSPPPSRPLDPPPSPYHPPRPAPCCLEMGSDRPSPLPIPLSAAPARVHARLSRGAACPRSPSFGTRADRAGCEGGRSLTDLAPGSLALAMALLCGLGQVTLRLWAPLPPQPENRIGFLATQAFLRSQLPLLLLQTPGAFVPVPARV